MKELSIEEKAKAYDEALKVANKYKDTHIMFPSIKEEMFPELTESGDEKIRKYLKHIIGEWSYDDLFAKGFRKEDIIAWLEKQGTPSKLSEEQTHQEVTKKSGQDELTELEKAVLDIVSDHNTHTDSVVEFARRNANKLLSIARKQIISEVDPEQLTENFKQYVLLKEANGCDGPLISLGTDCYKRGIKYCLDEIELKGIVRKE